MLATFVTALAFAAAVGSAAPAAAAGPPPSIDDLNGATFEVRSSGIEYDLNGDRYKADTTITWTITKTGPTTVSFDSVFGGMLFTANYVGGFLMQSYHSGGDPPEWGSAMYVAVTGKPGSLKLKGKLIVHDGPPDYQVLRVTTVTGSQTISPQ